jgi:hypothetical protein
MKQSQLTKKAGLLEEHLQRLIVSMVNEGYTDEDIFNMVESSLMYIRSGAPSEPLTDLEEDLTDYPGPPTERVKINMVAKKFMRKLGLE